MLLGRVVREKAAQGHLVRRGQAALPPEDEEPAVVHQSPQRGAELGGQGLPLQAGQAAEALDDGPEVPKPCP